MLKIIFHLIYQRFVFGEKSPNGKLKHGGGQLVNGKNNIKKKKSPKVVAYDNDVMVLCHLSNV